MDIKIGTIAYSTQTGLGIQSRDFAKHMGCHKVLTVDLFDYNFMPVDHSWHPEARVCKYPPNDEDLEWLTDDVDILVVHETPLNHNLYTLARAKGVKTIQIFNYEFIDGYKHPEWPRPDYMGAPTIWQNDQVRELNMGEVISWPVAVDRKNITPRAIGHCETFFHIIGRPTYLDRNGTIPFLQAAYELRGRFKFQVFLQEPTDPKAETNFREVRQALNHFRGYYELITDVPTPNDLYQGDVLVLPRRYGGLCLPMQESLAAGIPVIMTDINPNYQRLPKEWLVPATYQNNFFFHAPVDVYDINPSDLTLVMQRFADDNFMGNASRQADYIADQLSWETLKPYYLETLERCLA